MTLQKYKDAIRKYRGHLKDMDEDLRTIYVYGTEMLKDYTLARKDMGVRKLAYIAQHINQTDQINLVAWLLETPRKKTAIELKIAEIEMTY